MKIKHIMVMALATLFLTSTTASEIEFITTEETNVRQFESYGGPNLLTTVATLPAGTIIKYSTKKELSKAGGIQYDVFTPRSYGGDVWTYYWSSKKWYRVVDIELNKDVLGHLTDQELEVLEENVETILELLSTKADTDLTEAAEYYISETIL